MIITKKIKFDKILEIIIASESENSVDSGIVTFVNPYSIFSLADLEMDILDKLNIIYSDGILLIWLMKLFGIGKIRRRSMDFTSLMRSPDFDNSDLRIGLIGATANDLLVTTNKLNKALRCNFIAVQDGYCDFSCQQKIKEIKEKLQQERIDVVLVGLGPGLQEQVAVKISDGLKTVKIITCGGFLTQTAGSSYLEYYPKIIDRLNLRWAYRFFREPHTRKRYFKIVPFLFHVTRFALTK